MSNVTVGILLLIAGNLFASLSDVAVKLLNGEVPALQYIFPTVDISAHHHPFVATAEKRTTYAYSKPK